ncbi:disks large-associated protein 5 isoform X2 [Pseudophryne corroboree]|uniref:disks large-associated protein 5 isoform X2 n=1 Tax=Pseudophryne corroboree TaxID=495146 RepID=UPI00308132ED
MDIQSQYAGLYKKNSSIDHIRAKVARRKSITQKENRHRAFRKSRGLALADVNISPVKEQDLTVVEEANESGHGRSGTKPDAIKAKDVVTNERRAMLQRFKEEKQQRKLKEQQEKAKRGIFKCGIYKADNPFVPVIAPQNAVKVKQKEKLAAPSVTRVTRSTAKTDRQTQPVSVAVHKASADRTITRGRGQSSTVKGNEKENKVYGVPPATSTRSSAMTATKHSITTRSTVMTASKLSTASTKVTTSKPSTSAKAPLKKTAAAAKSQKKTTNDLEEEIVFDNTEHPVVDQLSNKLLEETVALKDTAAERVAIADTSSFVHERKPSFAPDNFVFQPLHGLSALKFPPMTPTRANAFLTPSCTWSPMASKSQFVVTRKHHTEEHKSGQVSPPELSLKATDVTQDTDILSAPPVKECTSDRSSAVAAGAPVTLPSCEPIPHFTDMDNKSAQQEELQHDVPYFRDILKSEIQKLKLLCSEWDERVAMDIPEDAKALIRTTVGQTRLLMNERFKQFEGLVDHCEFKTGEKETTCTDLEGFWDMIYFQIEDVSRKFVNLGKMEESSWQQNAVQAKKIVKKKIAPAATVKQSQGDNGRAAARNRLAAIKAALKNKSKTEEQVSDPAVSELPMQAEPVVFDAGFFRIESPAKLPSSLRKIDRSSSRTSSTPKKVPQNSMNPANNVEDLQVQNSPSHVESPLRKALFAADASLQKPETNAMVITSDNTESDTVLQVVDLTKYLVPGEAVEVEYKEFSLTSCLQEHHTSPLVDDVFMGSPEKAVHSTKSDDLGSPKVGPDEVGVMIDPLDFLRSCTPTMVNHAPLWLQSTTAASDLIVFSPLEK